MSIVAILVSVISASYYLQIIKVIHFPSAIMNQLSSSRNDTEIFEEKNNNTSDINSSILHNEEEENNSVHITNMHSMTISFLTLSIVLFILNPSLILNSTHLLALTIFNS